MPSSNTTAVANKGTDGRAALRYAGLLLRQERLRRDWSQDGLCRGICAVSYLSKIEQGRVEPAPELLRQLFARLKLPWYDDAETLRAGGALLERISDAYFGAEPDFSALASEFSAWEARLTHSPLAPEALLLRAALRLGDEPPTEIPEAMLDRQQLALLRDLQNRPEEAAALCPCAVFFLHAGIRAYERGQDYSAIELLQQANAHAAEEGRAHILLLSRLFLGNCFSNRQAMPEMERQYRAAARLARSLGREDILASIRYNTAATQLAAGDFASAYAFFSQLPAPDRMDLHKLAVCCEKLGRREEALDAIARAEALSKLDADDAIDALSREMLALVRFRLEQPDYLHCPDYGARLLRVFADCRAKLPVGYAAFHLPWVLEWYTANRQYRLACELMRDFPLNAK